MLIWYNTKRLLKKSVCACVWGVGVGVGGGGGAIEEGGGGGRGFYCHIKITFFLIIYVFESSPLKARSRLKYYRRLYDSLLPLVWFAYSFDFLFYCSIIVSLWWQPGDVETPSLKPGVGWSIETFILLLFPRVFLFFRSASFCSSSTAEYLGLFF